MSLFRKPKKNIQRRVFSANDDDEDGNFREKMEIDSDIQIPNPPPAPRIKKPDKKEKIPQNKQTLLSFGDEEEGEVFQVKKSSQSKKIMKLLDKERRKKEKSVKNPAEIKIESEFETNSEAQNLKESSNKPSNLLMENIQILNGRAALCAGKNDISDSDDEENQRQPVHKFSRSENQNSTGSKVDNFKVILESGQIPDAAMIHAARKKRQRARELGGGANQDYIPMQDSNNDSNENKTDKDNGKGRLVRERDEDFSDEERIDMNVNLKAKEMDSRREQFFASQGQESEHDTDKEMEEWENQQIRKGVTGAQLMAASQESMYGQLPDIKSEFIPEVIHEPGALRTPESIVGKLKERLNLVKASLSTHETDLNKVISERDELERDLCMKEERAPKCGEKFRFYQELRGYVTDLVECLDEKISDIYSIEQRALDLMASQAEKLIERRRQDVRDQAEELSSQQRPGIKPPEDEKKIRRAAEREGRRNRRRRLRETENEKFSQKNSHFDGMSSDDEISDLDKLNYEKCVETLQNERNQIFQDVVEDFCDIKKILEHFDNWKKYDYESYNEAYVSLVIPKILGPFLRLELIFWNPLKEISDFEKKEFYKEIMNYGGDPKNDLKLLKNDSDVLLVPNVIEKIFIPKLTLVVEKIWDPLSTSENLRLISIISKFIRKYPTLAPDSKNLTLLFNQIVEKFKISIENDVFIPIFRKTPTSTNFDSKSSNPFFQRQFNSALKLLKNICSWSSLINDKILKNLALTLILNRYLLSAVNVCNLVDGVSKLNLISHSIPRIWLNGETKELIPFNNCVMKFGGHLDKENPLHLESIEIVSGILKTLRCNT